MEGCVRIGTRGGQFNGKGIDSAPATLILHHFRNLLSPDMKVKVPISNKGFIQIYTGKAKARPLPPSDWLSGATGAA